jgi:hypothetical protein
MCLIFYELGFWEGLVLWPRAYLESYFLGTRVSRSYYSEITVARHCSSRGIFGRKGFILARVLIRFWFKYSL